MKILRYTVCLLFICLSNSLTEGASYRLIGEHALDIGNHSEYQLFITEYPDYGTVNWVGTSSEEIVAQENIAGYNTVRIEMTTSISPLGNSWSNANGYLTPDYLVEVRYEDEDMIELVRNNDPFEFLPVWINDTDNNRYVGHGQYAAQLKDPFYTWDGYQDAWITFLRTETITVSAGTFDCIVVFIRSERHDFDGIWGYYEVTRWVYPEVGTIKSDEYSWLWDPYEQKADITRCGTELTSMTYGNPPPEISSVTATPSTILDNQTSQLQVIATDSSPLSYNWIIQPGQGTLDDYNTATPLYTPPDIIGAEQTFNIIVEVSDGSKTSSSSVDINIIDINSITCDFYKDGFVDFIDFAILADYFAFGNCTEPDWCQGTDVDHSGNTDFSDLFVFTECWLSEVIDPDLIAYWPMDDNDSTAFVSDVSGNGHEGTATTNTELLSAPGVVNTCFDFAGADAVEVNDHAELSFDDSGNNPFSISAWVFVTSTGNTQMITSKWEATGAAEWRFKIDGNLQLGLDFWDTSASAGHFILTDDLLTTGWHHVVVTYDSTGGTNADTGVTFYIDGSSMATTTSKMGTYVAMEDTTTKVVIGSYYLSTSLANYFADKIDNVKIFSKCLTAAEITILYGEGL